MDNVRFGLDDEREREIGVYVCAPSSDDIRLFVAKLPPGNPHKIAVVSFKTDALTLRSDVEELDVSVVVLSPQVNGYSDRLVAELSRRQKVLVVVGLVPPEGDWGKQMMDAGAVGILQTPVSEWTIQKFVSSVPVWMQQAAEQRLSSDWVPVLPPGMLQAVQAMGFQRGIWPFWSPKGGVGKTTMACNAAGLLGVVANRPTLLVDANMNGGHVDLHMGINPPTTIFSLANRFMLRGQILPADLKGHVVLWRSGTALEILAGIQRVEQAGDDCLRGEQGERFIQALLACARSMYDFIIVDLGSSVNQSVHRAVLQMADGVVVLTTPDRASLVDIKSVLETLERVMGMQRSRYTLVVNMWTDSAGLSRAEIARFVRLAEAGVVPMDPRFMESANVGVPYALGHLQDRDATTQAVVSSLVGVTSRIYPPLETIFKARGKGVEQKPGFLDSLARFIQGV